MSIFHSNTERLLNEFPGMWAIRSKWSSATPLKASTISDAMLRAKCDHHRTKWWMMINYGDTQEVVEIDATPDVSLANATLREINELTQVAHLVSCTEGKFTIWRAHLGTNIRKMCEAVFRH